MSDNLKKLTGKNPNDFEPIAYSLINQPDVELFKELVSQEDFLFDFVKQNVASRLEKVCNSSNYLNLLSFLKYYSPSYEEFIISTLVKYADEDLTDTMLEIFENGTEDEKTYCAKFFSYIQDSLAIDYLRLNAYSENQSLASNCAATLGVLADKFSFDEAIEKLHSDDDFVKLDAVKFLVSYGKKEVSNKIIDVIKQSAMSENMAVELLYLRDWFSLYEENNLDALYILNLIINGLGEISSLSQVFDFALYEIISYLFSQSLTSPIAVVLLNTKDKFETLTENDEYLYDESKDVKQEVFDIKSLFSDVNEKELKNIAQNELKEDSLFVFTALDFAESIDKIRVLLKSSNPTVILKSLEVLKSKCCLSDEDKLCALKSLTDENLIKIVESL